MNLSINYNRDVQERTHWTDPKSVVKKKKTQQKNSFFITPWTYFGQKSYREKVEQSSHWSNYLSLGLWFSALAMYWNHPGSFTKILIPKSLPQSFWFNWYGVWPGPGDCNMHLRLRTAALGDNDNQQSQLKKLAEALFCLTVYNMNTERAWKQCHPGTNEDP